MVHSVFKVHCERSVLYQWWVIEIWVWSFGGVILWRENQSTWRRNCPSSIWYTTNIMWTGLKLNRRISTENLTTNCLSLFQRYCNLYWILNMCWRYKELTSVLVSFWNVVDRTWLAHDQPTLSRRNFMLHLHYFS